MKNLWSKSKNIKRFFKSFYDLPKAARDLTVANAILALGTGLSGLFLNVFLWKTANSIHPVVFFNMVQFPSVFVTYYLIGTLKRRLQIRYLFIGGFLLYIAVYALIILLGENSNNFLLLLGFLFGAATGLYWAGNNAMVYLETKDDIRHKFFAVGSSVGSIISVISPMIATIIFAQSKILSNFSFTGYDYLFAFIIVTFALGIFFSLRLPKASLPRLNSKDIIEPIKSPLWRIVALSSAIDGFKGGVSGFIMSILTYEILTSELNMGMYNSIFALASAFVAYRLSNILTKDNRLRYGFYGAALLCIASITLIGLFSVTGFIIFSVITLIANPLFSSGMSSSFYKVVDHKVHEEKDYFKFITFREGALNFGRLSGALLFLLFISLGNDLTIAKSWYLGLGFAPLAFVGLTHIFENIIKDELAYEYMVLEEDEEEDFHDEF